MARASTLGKFSPGADLSPGAHLDGNAVLGLCVHTCALFFVLSNDLFADYSFIHMYRITGEVL